MDKFHLINFGQITPLKVNLLLVIDPQRLGSIIVYYEATYSLFHQFHIVNHYGFIATEKLLMGGVVVAKLAFPSGTNWRQK